MDGWTLTKVWRVNGKLVVADTIEKAIELYRKYTCPTVSIKKVEAECGYCSVTNDAIIEKNT